MPNDYSISCVGNLGLQKFYARVFNGVLQTSVEGFAARTAWVNGNTDTYNEFGERLTATVTWKGLVGVEYTNGSTCSANWYN